MVYGIVQQHKGDVFVSSEPGKGTAFKIYFPLFTSRSEKLDSEEKAISKEA
jgi:signal transduction histidine kinase